MFWSQTAALGKDLRQFGEVGGGPVQDGGAELSCKLSEGRVPGGGAPGVCRALLGIIECGARGRGGGQSMKSWDTSEMFGLYQQPKDVT